MPFLRTHSGRGFTLIELLVVMAIIGVLATVVMVAVSDARMKGRDAARKTQVLEVLKALEIHHSGSGTYPLYGGSSNTGGFLSGIGGSFFGAGNPMTREPDNSATDYYYCVSTDQRSALLAVNTEQDKGGSNFCSIFRGPGPTYGCTAWIAANATSPCLSRF